MSDKPPESKPEAAPASQPAPAPAPKNRGPLLRKLGIAAGVLVVLMVVAFFVCTSSGFITGVILPRVGPVIGAQVTAGSVSLSPFSSVEVRDLKVKTVGDEPLLETASFKATYSLMDIIGGKITVSGVQIESPTVRVIKQADGKSNLDPILAALAAQPPKPKSQTKLNLNVGPVSLKNANVQVTMLDKSGSKTAAEIKGLNVTVDGVKNGQPIKADIDAALSAAFTGPKQSDTVAASLKGSVQTELSDDMMPKMVKAGLNIGVNQATGAFADAASLNTGIDADLTLKEIKQLALNFTKGGSPVGQVAIKGPFDTETLDGKLNIAVTGIGNEVLSLVGAKFGIYFGSTKLAANYDIELKNKAQSINTTGTVTGDKFSLTRGGLTTPTLDLRLGYNVAIDLASSNANIREFSFAATKAGQPMLTASLSKPMAVNWGKGAEALDESALDLAINQLNLADWRTFLGTNVTAGSVDGKISITSRKAGKDISLDVSTKLTGLAAEFGPNKLDRADVQVSATGQVADLSRVALSSYKVNVAQAGQRVADLAGSGSFDSATFDASFQTSVDANLVAASRLLGRDDLKFTSGSLKFDGKVTQLNKGADQSVIGNVQIQKLIGNAMGNKFDRFELATDIDAGMKNLVATINKASGTLSQAGAAGGSFEASGSVDTAKLSGQMTFKLTDLNENILRSFTAPLAPNELKSASIGANAQAKFDTAAGATITGDFSVANVVIKDPAGQLPQTPLTMKVNLDAGYKTNGVADLRKLTGGIQLGSAKGGDFDVSGTFNTANQSGQFTLKLADLNENAIRPFAAAALGETTLSSVSINADASGTFDAAGSSSVKGSFNVAKLLLTNPQGTLPKDPLSIGVNLDAGMAKQVVDLRALQLKLTPTARAKNELNVTGKVDLSKTNALAGQLKVMADALDVTPYYDMFAGPKSATPAKGGSTSTQSSASKQPADAAPQKEPDAIKLPIDQFATDVNIGKFYLREIALDNLQVGTKLDATTVDVNPFKLTFNGAPVSAQVHANLGVPGYQYDVKASVDRLPIAPIVDTFVTEFAGKAKGDLIFNTSIKGAGITGDSIRRTLGGNVAMTVTNASVIIPDPKQTLHGPIGTIARVMLTILGPLAPIINVGVDDLITPPVAYVDTLVKLGGGQIGLNHFTVLSDAFKADAAGTVTISEVLTNSPINDIPVQIAFSKPIAKKAHLDSEDRTVGNYVTLPNFVKLGGTIGEPKPDINKLVIVGIVARSTAGVPGLVGDKAGNVLKGVGNLLGGDKTPPKEDPNAKAAPATNAPAIKINPFDLFKKKK